MTSKGIEFQPIPVKEPALVQDEDCYFDDDSDNDDLELQQERQPPTPASCRDRFCTRRCLLVTIISLLLLAGVGGTGAWWFLSSRSKNHKKKDKWPTPTIRDENKNNDFLIYNRKDANDISTIQDIRNAKLPYLIYGTAWKEDKTDMYVDAAVRNGFVFVDTANQPKHYNETGTGFGWKTAAAKLGLSREQVYLQTKFSTNQDLDTIPYDSQANLSTQVYQSFQSSLEHLQTDYLDAYILHSPLRTPALTLEVWKAMETLVDEGRTKRIGISNCYSLETFQQLYNQSRIKPTILQNHFRVRDFNTELFRFTQTHNIEYQGFWTLTSNRKLLQRSEVIELASNVDTSSAAAAAVAEGSDGDKNQGMTPQEYMYAFLLEIGIVPLDGTKSHQIDDANLIWNLQTKSIQPFQNKETVEKMATALGLKL